MNESKIYQNVLIYICEQPKVDKDEDADEDVPVPLSVILMINEARS